MKKRKVVSLGALICACMLLAHLTAAGPPQTTRLTDTTVVMEGPSNVEAIGNTRNTESGTQVSEKPRMVMTNWGKMVPWVQGAPADQGTLGNAGSLVRSRGIGYDGAPGTGAPPATLGGFPMTPFPDNPNPLGTVVTTAAVPSPPCDGVITFDPAMQLQAIGSGWMTWSHGYTGQVYVPEAYASITTLLITMPDDTCAFYLYVEPNSFSTYAIECIANEGLADEISSGDVMVTGDSGATYFGFFCDAASHIQTVRVNADPGALGFAVGEFGIFCSPSCAPAEVACCDDATATCEDLVPILDCIASGGRYEIGIEYCDDLVPPCGQQVGACCCGAVAEPGVCEAYECIGDMFAADCLAAGEETFWTPGESCDASPPFDCGAPTYCDGSGGCDEYISNVYLVHASGTINNSSGCTGYGDYTDQVALMLYSMSYDITVTNGNYYSSDVTAVWVDWNGDKDWDDDGERVMNVDPGGAVATGTITVPPTAIPGYTRMRIRIDYANPTPSPCGTTTYGEVEDYTVLISGEVPFGACCDPTIGECTDGVEATDCLPPKQFAMDQLCEDAFPNCGDRGACCYDLTEEGDCVEDVLALDCDGTRHAPGATCADFDPPCGALAFIFVTDPGSGPPPDTQCGCLMTVFPDDPRPTLVDVNDVPSPCPAGGDIEFSIPLSHRKIGSGWASWSHGYTGDVYYTNGATEVTLTLPPGSCGFYMYVEPNPFAVHTFKLIANGVIESEEFTADGQGGAAYAGVCGAGLETITVMCTSGVDFAIGEFGICCFCGPAYGACCDLATGECTDNVEVMDCPLSWSYQKSCAGDYPPPPEDPWPALDPPCGDPGCCCWSPESGTEPEDPTVEFAINCDGRFLSGVTGGDCVAEAFEPDCGLWVPTGVLYCPSEADNPTFRTELSAALLGSPVDYFDTRTATPTLEFLADYAAVFTWVNYPYADNVAMGNVLADYVDGGGRVILGQWCLPTAGNFLSGRIMTEGYCPASASMWTSDSYAGDGFKCPTLGVDSFSSSYFDQTTTLPWAFNDGTTVNGYAFVSMNPPWSVWYSPGNTSTLYSSGDVVQLTANMVTCVPEPMYGACCDPATAICEDGVELMDCLPPLQFHHETLCSELYPPCGNPGACCNIYTGECEDNVLELNCPAGFRFEGGEQCAEMEPECGTPGACCDDSTAECTIEFQANCPGRFIADAACEPDPWEELGQPACGEWECSGILYAPSQPDNPAWRAQVAALTGQPCDYWDASASIPTLADLQNYCCVFTWGNYAYADAVGFGNVLAEFADRNGKVILGQWTYHTTQTNWLEGEIMEPEYCPVTCTSYGYDSYVDGSGTDCIFCNVHEFYGSYVDQCTVRPGAMEDGSLAGGKLAAGWRTDRRVYYDPGNTGGDYTTGDTAQIIANICACTGPEALGACCDPTTGTCTDAVDCADCLPPLQFSIGKACADLDPPCGDPGCCCYPEDGENPLEPYEALAANCDGRFLSGVLGDDCVGTAFDPECGLYAACQHSITMWDSYGDGWNGCTIDVYVNGDLVLAGATLLSGAGPETVYFPAGTGATIFVDFTCVSWCTEPSYCVYDGFGLELGCATGGSGAGEGDLTVTGNCEAPVGGCCLGTDGCQVITGDECTAAGGTYLGNFTDCGDMADCDGDGMTDLCAIVAGAEDCDGNGIPDSCELAGNDCQPDGILDACQLYTRPVCCGDGYCVEGEDCEWCPEDCGACPYCGDGICQPAAGEDCLTCPEDCGPCPECADFIVTAPGSFPGNTCGAGNDCALRASEEQIFQVIIPEDGEWVFSLCDGTATWDTYMYLGTTCCDPGDEVAYNDDFCGLQSQITATITAGTYYVTVEGYSSTACGPYVLDISGGGGGPGSGDCCWDHYPETGCEDPVCEASVCSYDSYCCDYGWDEFCADEAATDPNCDCSSRGAGGGVRNDEALISQLPNQSNGIFSDCDCSICGQPQVLAENFILAEDVAIGMMRFWGGMYSTDGGVPPDFEWYVCFYADAGGVPGAEIECFVGTADAEQTGIVLFGVHEWQVDFTISPPLALAAGTYHVAAYCYTGGLPDDWFWEAGNFDSAAGIMGQAYGFVCPPAFPYYDSATDMAFELYAGVSGPPINDCNENGVPDECDLDCNNNCIPDDCEEGPVTCGSLIVKQGACPAPFNRSSHGVTPMALVGAEFFDVTQVDLSSIRLSRVGEAEACQHSITMWDSYGNGWNGCTIDVYVNGEMVLEDVAIGYGSGPETVYFEAETGDTIFVDFTCVSWCTEPSYCVYDGEGTELGCATGGYNPGDGDLTVTGNCPAAGLIGSVAPCEGPPGPHTQLKDLNHPYVGEGPCACNEDEASDGIMDIAMKFRSDDMVEELGLDDLSPGELALVVITGQTIGGSPFMSPTDCLRLVPPGTSSHMLTVESNRAQVPIEVSPLDDTLDGGGFANFTRSYPETTEVTLTAEAHTPDGKPFKRWLIDGVPQSAGALTIQVVVDDATTVQAVYNLLALVPPALMPKPPGWQLPGQQPIQPGVPVVPELP